MRVRVRQMPQLVSNTTRPSTVTNGGMDSKSDFGVGLSGQQWRMRESTWPSSSSLGQMTPVYFLPPKHPRTAFSNIWSSYKWELAVGQMTTKVPSQTFFWPTDRSVESVLVLKSLGTTVRSGAGVQSGRLNEGQLRIIKEENSLKKIINY